MQLFLLCMEGVVADITEEALITRTKVFVLRAIGMSEALPETRTGRVIANQLIRAATSVGANYRAACRSRSAKDFANKLGVVVEESDESAYWIELAIQARLMQEQRVADLLNEANELTAIFVASHKTASRNLHSNRKSKVENPK